MIPLYRPPIPAGLTESLHKLVLSGWWGYGPASDAVERYFTTAHGGSALAVNSGTTALFLVGRLLNPSPGDEVIVPALTYVSTAMAFHEAGFTVKLADVDESTLLLDCESVERLLSSRTRAIVAVHLYGQRGDVRRLAALCRDRRIAIVEDRAHRIGIADPPGGDFACYSFNPMKEAPAGEGGLLWCRYPDAGENARVLSNLGIASETWQRTRSSRHDVYAFGLHSGLRMRMSDVTATFVLASLRHVHEWRERRLEIFTSYAAACAAAGIRLRGCTEDDSYLMAICRIEGPQRETVRATLEAAGISTSTSHYPALSRHPLWCDHTSGCSRAEKAADEVLTLPLFPVLRNEDVSRVCAALLRTTEVLK